MSGTIEGIGKYPLCCTAINLGASFLGSGTGAVMYPDSCSNAPTAKATTSSKTVYNEGLKQSLLCRHCGKRFIEHPLEIQYSDAFNALVFKAPEERVSLRGIERRFGVRRQTVAHWIKKRQSS